MMKLEWTGTLNYPANAHLRPSRPVAGIAMRLISLGWILLTAFTVGAAVAFTSALAREAPSASTEIVTATSTLPMSTQEPFTVLCEDPHPTCIPPR